MRFQTRDTPTTAASTRLRTKALFASALLVSAVLPTATAHAQDVRSTQVEVWTLPDMNPWVEGTGVWVLGTSIGQWVDGIPSVGTGAPNFLGSVEAESELGIYLGTGFVTAELDLNGTLATISSQLVSAGSVQFSPLDFGSPSTLTGAVNVSRNSPAGSGDFTVTGFSFAGPDAGVFDLPSFVPTAISAGQQTAAFDLGFTGTPGGEPLAATLTFTTDTGLELPVSILAPASTAADVRVLPDVNPWVESAFTWFDGDATGQWSDGIPLVGTGAESEYLSPAEENDILFYLSTGQALVTEDVLTTTQATASDQLVAPGQTTVKVWDNDLPQTIFDAVLIERSGPEGSADLLLTAYEILGPDAAFFDLDLFTAIASDGLTPGSGTEDPTIAFDLIFNPDGLALGDQTDFEATINFTADTGLIIPVNVSATTVPEPSSLALLAVGSLAMIRRRR